MVVFPLVQLELNVRARKRGSYWLRFAVGLAGALFCLPQLVFSDSSGGISTVGKTVFDGLAVIGFLICSGLFFFTVDTISSERREGTLGLLFLTRVKWFDVVLGKLASNGIVGLLVLTSLLPLLMIPILSGGVTGGETFRKGLALLNTLFLSLAVGVYASAKEQERFKAMRKAALWLFFLLLIVPLLLIPNHLLSLLGTASPLSGMIVAGDSWFKASPLEYWLSLAGVQTVGWIFLFRAGVNLRRAVQDEETIPTTDSMLLSEPYHWPGIVRPNSWISHKHTLSPAQWIAQRQRGTGTMLWAGALIGVFYLFFYRYFLAWGSFSRSGLVWSVANWLPHTLLSAASGAFFAWASTRFFVEGRKTGELELLLTTPLPASSIISSQWKILKKASRGPVAVMMLGIFLPFAFLMTIRSRLPGPDGDWVLISSALSLALSGANTFLAFKAICLAGLWFGTRASGQLQAIVWTVCVVKGCPYLISLLGTVFLGLTGLALHSYSARGSPSAYYLVSYLPGLATLLFYLWLIRTAKRNVLRQASLGETGLPGLQAVIAHFRRGTLASELHLRNSRRA